MGEEAVLVQQHHAELVVKAVGAVVLHRGDGQVDAVAVGKLHQVDGQAGEVLMEKLVLVGALHHQHLPKGGGDVPFLKGRHVGDKVHDVIIPELVQLGRGVGSGAV